MTNQKHNMDASLTSKCALDKTFYGETLSVQEFESLFELQSKILESFSDGASLRTILDHLCYLAEKLVPNALASIMVLDEKTGVLNVKAAPSVPPEGIQRLNNLKPGKGAGSCGNAIFRQQPVFVENTQVDPRWEDIRDLAIDFDLQACWSMPIYIRAEGGEKESKLIGTFALTSFENRMPNLFQHKVLEVCANIAGMAIRHDSLEKQVRYLAYHDELTGLANRACLEGDISSRLEKDNQTPFSLILLGLDRFKAINDAHGHDVGDRVLQAVARRLEAYLKGEFVLYRIGSDEFAILFQRKNCDYPMVESFCEGLLAHLETPFYMEKHSFYLSGSIGVACALNKQGFYDLMKEADTAMYAAKAHQMHKIRFYDHSMAEKLVKNIELEGDLHNAIKNNEFVVYYQPLMAEDGQSVKALEALIRWQHPTKGLIPPFEFIPIVEEIGLIQEVTKCVVQQSIANLKQWHRKGLDQFKVSVNISGRAFSPDQVQELVTLIKDAQLCAYFEFELTEGYLMEYAEASIQLLERVRAEGITIAIDDFGTGYSSLAYLKRFPVDKLKIDQSLVRDIVEDENDQAIVKAVVAMGHSLGLKVVAEGVETQAHHKLLEKEGIDLLQGYLFAKPKPAVLTEKFLKLHAKVPT